MRLADRHKPDQDQRYSLLHYHHDEVSRRSADARSQVFVGRTWTFRPRPQCSATWLVGWVTGVTTSKRPGFASDSEITISFHPGHARCAELSTCPAARFERSRRNFKGPGARLLITDRTGNLGLSA